MPGFFLLFRVIYCSLSPSATLKTVVHAFVYSSTCYCSAIYAGLQLGCIAQLEHVLHSAANLFGGFSKFDHVTHYIYMHDDHHWLSVSQHIEFRFSVWVWWCQLGSVPA